MEGTFVLPPLRVMAVHRLDKIELPALPLGGDRPIADVGDQLVDLRELRIDIGSLVTPGKKADCQFSVSLIG